MRSYGAEHDPVTNLYLLDAGRDNCSNNMTTIVQNIAGVHLHFHGTHTLLVHTSRFSHTGDSGSSGSFAGRLSSTAEDGMTDRTYYGNERPLGICLKELVRWVKKKILSCMIFNED